MKVLLKNKSLIFVFFFLFVTDSFAQSKIQVLDPQLSSVRFTSHSLLQASGKFISYNGQILVNSLSKKIEDIKLTLNASKIQLDPTDNPMQMLTVTELLKTLPNALLHFTSQEVIPLEKNNYRILGYITRGTQKWNVNFRVNLNTRNPKQTECIFKNETKVPQGNNDIPSNLNAIGGNLEFEGKLVFREKN